jgi:hypothetical protein
MINFINNDYDLLYHQRDDNYFKEIHKIILENNISLQSVLQNYMVFIRRREFAQSIAYYHLFEIVKNKPGSIAEFGVFLGNGLFTWSKLIETFCPGVRGRKVFGFDSFEGYRGSNKTEKNYIKHIQDLHGHTFQSSEEIVKQLIRINETDNIIMGAKRIELFSGDVKLTIGQMKSENPGVRFCLVMIDLNLFEPTKLVLEEIYELVIRGGVVAFRGYGVKPWEGESAAVDLFVKKNSLELKNFTFSPYPGAYLIKE